MEKESCIGSCHSGVYFGPQLKLYVAGGLNQCADGFTGCMAQHVEGLIRLMYRDYCKTSNLSRGLN